MHVRVIALYPGRISSLIGKPGVRFRKRKKSESTLVPCRIETAKGCSIAVPEFEIPDGTAAPTFKAQLETARMPVEQRSIVCVVLSPTPDASHIDPEQLVLSPIYDDGRTMIFEFKRALIVSLRDKRNLEVRLVAVHPADGTVGTKTIYTFNTRFIPLAGRCMEYLAGAIDLFPPPPRFARPEFRGVPPGEADLAFEPRRRTSRAVVPDGG